jgi:hypothetical protein
MATARNLHDVPVTRTPDMCASNWPANAGDTIAWTNPPTPPTTITAVDSNPAHWPFNLPSGFLYRNPATVMIRTNCAPGPYSYIVGSCTDQAGPKVVDVG